MSETITSYEFFYDGQQSRYLEQVVRAFSGFSYQTGTNGQGGPQTTLVPCHMALTNQMVSNIKSDGSENTLLDCPQITVWQTGLHGRKDDVQNPGFIGHLQVTERNIVDGVYGPNQGNMYSVDRIMPVPFTMDIQVDVWTSNLLQKYQLSEQILTVVYPQFVIQNSENGLDWTSVTYCFVDEDIQWSSRQIPIGTSTEIDIFSLKLRIPMYLTAPAKVKKISRITQIVAPLVTPPSQISLAPTNNDVIEEVVANITDNGQQLLEAVVTPNNNFWILVDNTIITLRSNNNADTLPDGSIPSWANLFNYYGIFNPGTSAITIALTSDIEGAFVVGTLEYGSQPNELVWTVDTDTLPTNTLPPIDGIIDPMKTFPGHGLPSVANGQRYMILSDIGNSVAWGESFSAEANDIIQYSTEENGWVIAFNSCINKIIQYVTNLYTGSQLKWTGTEWVFSIDGFYSPGFWRISL